MVLLLHKTVLVNFLLSTNVYWIALEVPLILNKGKNFGSICYKNWNCFNKCLWSSALHISVLFQTRWTIQIGFIGISISQNIKGRYLPSPTDSLDLFWDNAITLPKQWEIRVYMPCNLLSIYIDSKGPQIKPCCQHSFWFIRFHILWVRLFLLFRI